MLSRELDAKHKELLNKMKDEEENIRALCEEKKRLYTRVRSTPDDRSFEQINREIHQCEENLKKLQDEYVNTPVVYPVRHLKPILKFVDEFNNVIKEPEDKIGTFRFYYYPYGQQTAARAVVDVEGGVPKRIRFLEWHSDYRTNLPVTIEIPLEVGHIEFVKVVEKEVVKEVPRYVNVPIEKEEDSDITQSTNRLNKSKGILDKILKRGDKHE